MLVLFYFASVKSMALHMYERVCFIKPYFSSLVQSVTVNLQILLLRFPLDKLPEKENRSYCSEALCTEVEETK